MRTNKQLGEQKVRYTRALFDLQSRIMLDDPAAALPTRLHYSVTRRWP